MTCVVCGAGEAESGHLCGSCLQPLQTCPTLCQEQLSSRSPAPLAALVDGFGQLHPIGASTLVGRFLSESGVSVAEGSVSRRHAQLTRSDSQGWLVRDLGSTNGSFLDDNRLSREISLESGARLRFGDVSFYFTTSLPSMLQSAGGTTRRVATAHEVEEHGEDLPSLRVEVIEPTGGGGGLVRLDGHEIQLTAVQLDLIRALVERMVEDDGRDPAVRGYLHSTELLTRVGWETAHPSDNHLRQLVRRTRRQLAESGFDGLIESRHRFGYRLAVIPAP